MFWNLLKRGAGVCACMVALAAGVAAAQDPPEVRGPQEGQAYPPPTFFAPPGAAAEGEMKMPPQFWPQGVPMPQVIWQKGDPQQQVIKPSDHWVGLQCGTLSPALRAQLGLEQDQGVLVEAVVDDSPAAKAGIQQYDVLTRAGNRKLEKIQDLIDEVDAVKDGKLSIQLVRKGQKETLEVTPEKRPPMEVPADQSPKDEPGEWKDFFDHIQQWEPGKDGRSSMKFRFWHPGTILPGQEKMPDNVNIQIRKQGDKPTEIEVTRGDETWKLNDSQLDQLPDDLRPHVERLLGKPHGPAGIMNMPPQIFNLPKPSEPREGLLKKQLDDINRRFDRIEKSLEKLFDQPKAEEKTEPEPEAPETTPSGAEA